MARVWIGTSGFNYPHWRDALYPEGLPQTRWFEHYARTFNAVELNVTFYRLPSQKAFEGWARRAPEHFAFVLKGSRYVTHVQRLSRSAEALERFFAAAEPLGGRLTCVLWQLPPLMPADPERLGRFLIDLKRCPGARATRHAFEFRDPSWFSGDVYRTLSDHDAALVLADAPQRVLGPGMVVSPPGRRAFEVPLTAPFAYLRRHGPGRRFRSNYPTEMIEADARCICGWLKEGKDVFAFYNNDIGGHAVRNARSLAAMVSGDVG
jgi:uncharacterized protein YecE (DUF72 family)